MVIRSSTSFASKIQTGIASVDDFGAIGDGSFGSGTDSTAGFQAAIDWVAANPGPSGGGVVLIPPGAWRITAPLVVPSFVSFTGIGDESQVLMDNDVSDVYGGDIGTGADGLGLFSVFSTNPWSGNPPYRTNCQFRNFRVTGTNDPYVQVNQWQSAAIDFSNFADSMVVRNMTFENLHGFAVHGRGKGEALDVSGCRFIQVGNSGVNTGISHCTVANNSFSYCEGLEITGRNCQVIGNNFDNCGYTPAANQAAPVIVMGGNITSGGNFPGGNVIGNSITDSTGGIYIGSNATDYVCSNNTIIRVNYYAIILSAGGIPGQEPHRSVVSNNIIRSAGTDAGGTWYGIYVAGGDNVMVTNNNLKLNFEAGFNNAVFGIRCDSPGGVVRGNHVDGALTKAFYFRNAPDLTFESNTAAGNTDVDYNATVSFRNDLEVGHSGSFTGDGTTASFNAAHNLGTGEPLFVFRDVASGQVWGPGTPDQDYVDDNNTTVTFSPPLGAGVVVNWRAI